jgi:hypothetical protein
MKKSVKRFAGDASEKEDNKRKASNNTAYIQRVLTHSPRKSVRHLSQQLNLGESLTYRTVQKNVELFPYNIQIYLVHSEGDKYIRISVCSRHLHFLKGTPPTVL